MSTRLDLVLQKHPEHEDAIRLLASRDPSGNLKYLDWGAKLLVSGQALAPEIADVIDLFHQFSGREFGRRRGPRRERIRSDIYSYRPQDLASLRDSLRTLKRTRDRKRRERERLYRIEGTVEADVVYDAPDLVVRHIKNKQASCHYGLGTKWCISMRRENYFEDYETHNAAFFFFERTTKMNDDFDKVALVVPRGGDGHVVDAIDAFTSTDRRVDMMQLARVYGLRVFDIFREIYERSEAYPGSSMFRVYAGNATQEQCEAAFASVVNGKLNPYETEAILVAICCNDTATWLLLEEAARRALAIFEAALKHETHRAVRGVRRRHTKVSRGRSVDLTTRIAAALTIHPQVPADVREKIGKELKRRHIGQIHRTSDGDRVEVSYQSGANWRGRNVVRHRGRYRRRRLFTLAEVRRRLGMYERSVVRYRKMIKTMERKKKIADAKKKKKLATIEKRKSTKLR